MHPYVELAWRAVREYVREGRKTEAPDPLPPDMRRSAGVFVSIKKGGELRGCIGTIEAVRENLAAEIIDNAVSAATRDPRFPPIGPDELGELDISVDVLSAPEPVASAAQLDARKFGVIVRSGLRRALLLPDLEGVDTPEEQIAVCRRKGGIRPDEEVSLERFTVARHR